MCIGNRASSSAFYINRQIEILWELSNDCVRKHGYGIKASRAEIEYGSCLSQVCIGKHNQAQPSYKDLSFFASFGAAPEIKFICNHEVVLKLYIKRGQYKLEGKTTAETFEGYTCSFRVPFREHTITDSAYATYGQTAVCKAKLFILDLNCAAPLRDHCAFKAGDKYSAEVVDSHHKNITKCLTTYYLPLLRKSGFHCLYSLPDFDNLSRTHLIDYSTICDIEVETDTICSINIEAINNYLFGSWLEAIALIHGSSHGREHHDYDKVPRKCVLAEHRDVCNDTYFRAFYGPPQLSVRCAKEVVLTINIEELHFLEGGFETEISHKVSNWQISFIVEATLVEEEEGCVRRLKLDLSKSRFCEALSHCASETIESNILVKIRNVFIQYITQRYFLILEECRLNYVYHVDIRVEEWGNDEECFSDEECHEEGAYGSLSKSSHDFCERLTITEIYDCDTITAVSQGSINNYFRCLWKASLTKNGCLSGWSHDGQFDASFGPLQIQFPTDHCSRTVILYINLLRGYSTNMGVDKTILHGDTYEFQGWRLAFEVDVSLRDSRDAHKSFIKNDQNDLKWTCQQLMLDFKTAKVRFDLSKLEEIHGCKSFSAARGRLAGLLRYITHCYFAQLESENLHILYSIPILHDGRCLEVAHRYAPRTIDFQFFPAPYGEERKCVSCLFGQLRNYGERNMLVICGMVCDKKLPELPPSGSWRWSVCEERFSGVVALGRKVFLEGWLLCELEKINEHTTIVPHFHCVDDDGAWKIDFPVWKDHPSVNVTKNNTKCHWNKKLCAEGLQYEWKSHDDLTYCHERGDICSIYNGRYEVSCKTTNTLTLPTVNQRGSCEIKIEGKVELTLSFTGNEKQWTTTSATEWWTSIVIRNSANACGLEFRKLESIKPLKSVGFCGDTELIRKDFKDAASILRESLPSKDFINEETISTLVKLFSDVWPTFQSGTYGYTLASPTFNANGDLLLELASPLDRNGCVIVPKPESHGITLFDGPPGKSRYHENITRKKSSIASVMTTTTNGLSSLATDHSSSYDAHALSKSNGGGEAHKVAYNNGADGLSLSTTNHSSSHDTHAFSKSNAVHEITQKGEAHKLAHNTGANEVVNNNNSHEVVQSVSPAQKKKTPKKVEDSTSKGTAT